MTVEQLEEALKLGAKICRSDGSNVRLFSTLAPHKALTVRRVLNHITKGIFHLDYSLVIEAQLQAIINE